MTQIKYKYYSFTTFNLIKIKNIIPLLIKHNSHKSNFIYTFNSLVAISKSISMKQIY